MLGLIETIQREGVGMDDELRVALGKLLAPQAAARFEGLGLAAEPSQATNAREAISASGNDQGAVTTTLPQATSAGAAEPQSETADSRLAC